MRGVWCLLEKRPSFLSPCPRGVGEFSESVSEGVVSSGEETLFSEYVSEGCGVFGKGDRVF